MARYIKLEDAIEVCGKYKDLHKKENSMSIMYGDNFCSECGQALDWSDT